MKKEEINEVIAQRVYSIRAYLGLTQADMADLLKVKFQYLSSLENGKRKPGLLMMQKLIELCNQHGLKIDHKYFRPDLIQ